MLTFDIQDFKTAFHRTGYINLMVAGKPQRIGFTTARYEETRVAYIEAHPFPGRTVVRSRFVKAGTPEAKELGLIRSAAVEVYKPASDDTEYTRAVGKWMAGLGRKLAAACLQVSLMAGGKPLSDEALEEFYAKAMTDSQASEFASQVQGLITLEDQDAIDFFESSSDVDGASESLHQEG